ncbi:unnamed protein product [Miscanthus lutarioriparius]|uniref:Uncharacterized protein n=1 Tax=Miscanthus lutarioriparius TaxID=422564 RepID=A0A811Q358_9POAL|nr:unnamed protein product [Miscanthus lutarioriparius]
MGAGHLAADGTLHLGSRRPGQELIVVLVLVSGEIEGEIFAPGVRSHEGAEGEDDVVDVEHPSGQAEDYASSSSVIDKTLSLNTK